MLPRRSHPSAEPLVSRRALRWTALAGAAAAAFSVVSLSVAGFNSSTTAVSMTVSSKRIFPGVRSTSAWSLKDASGGAGEVDASDLSGFDDARPAVTGNWASAFSATRFYQLDFNSPRPAGVPASSVSFNIKYASKGGGGSGNACIYKIEVRRASDNSLLGTLDHSASPLCSVGTTYRVVNEDISSLVTSTDVANDLRIKIFGYETGARGWNIEYATVTGTSYAGWTLYEKTTTDQSTGTATTTSWGIVSSGDGVNYTSAANWATTFGAARYLKFTFDPGVATGSVITSVTLNFYYRSNTAGDTACWYGEAYNGATLLGSYGSSGTPQSCNTGNTTYSTDTVTMSQLTSANDANAVTDVNNLAVRAYMRESGGRKTQIDFVQLNVNYYLN